MSAPEHRELGPYGCLCRTLAIRMLGDGCDMCQPTSERRKGERRGSERRRYEVGYGHRLESDRRTTDRRKAE